MSEPLNHIFDYSACLTRRQLKDYTAGNISAEERYAVEHHLNSCLLCSAAIEGIAMHNHACVTLDEVSHSFLKEHFVKTSPQVHLNSMALTAPASVKKARTRSKSQGVVKPSTVAAAILLSIGALWYMEYGKDMQLKPGISKASIISNEQPAEETSTVPFTTEPAEQPAAVAEKTVTNEEVQPIVDKQQKQPPWLTAAIEEKKESKTEKKGKETEVAIQKQSMPVKQEIQEVAPPATTEKMPVANIKEVKEVKPKVEPKVNTEVIERDDNSNAEKLFQSRKYSAALSTYKKMMGSGDRRTRQEATLMAARCYMNMGKNGDATALLEELANNGNGSHKRTARRMLRAMSNETIE